MRILQGLSYAVLISVGYGMYRVIFPARSLGTIFGVNALVFAVGTALGPALGGLLVSYASWPWLFYINLPLGIAAIAFSLMALGKTRSANAASTCSAPRLGGGLRPVRARRRPDRLLEQPQRAAARRRSGGAGGCVSSVARPAPAVRRR